MLISIVCGNEWVRSRPPYLVAGFAHSLPGTVLTSNAWPHSNPETAP